MESTCKPCEKKPCGMGPCEKEQCCKEPCCKGVCTKGPCGKGPCPKECKKMKKKAMKIIESCVLLMCPEWEPLYQEVLQKAAMMMMKECCKAECGKKACCAGECKESCKKPCCGKPGVPCECEEGCCGKKCKEDMECQMECKIKCCLKGFISCCKDAIKERIDIGIESLKKALGDLPPFCEVFKKKFLKGMANLLKEMHGKTAGACQEACKTECCKGKCGEECKCKAPCKPPKECLMKIADKFWHNSLHQMEDCYHKEAHKIAKNAVFMCCDCNCDIGKVVAEKHLAHILSMRFHCQANKLKEECKEKVCEKGYCKKKRECLTKQAYIFAAKFVKDNCENIKICVGACEEAVRAACKETKCEFPEECVKKVIAKVATKCIQHCCCEPCTKEKCLEFATRYMKEIFVCCDKVCIKRCQKTFKLAMMMNGVTDKHVIHIGSKWGALMCCHVNGKTGCKKEEVALFAAKWVKDFTPIVTEAYAFHETLANECKECKGTFMREHFGNKKLLCYLRWNCAGGKFNKDDLKAHCTKIMEKMKAFCEKSCEMTCGKPCGQACKEEKKA